LGWLWPCPQILRPDWKGFLRINAPAYWVLPLAMNEKSFITLSPDFGPRLFSPHQDMQHGTNSYNFLFFTGRRRKSYGLYYKNILKIISDDHN